MSAFISTTYRSWNRASTLICSDISLAPGKTGSISASFSVLAASLELVPSTCTLFSEICMHTAAAPNGRDYRERLDRRTLGLDHHEKATEPHDNCPPTFGFFRQFSMQISPIVSL